MAEVAPPSPALAMLPRGRSLPMEAWARRHRGILYLLGAHAVGLAAFGLFMGVSPAHSLLEGALIGVIALAAAWPRFGRRARSVLAAFGAMSSSAALTHLSGGYIEAHFHFFVMLGVIFLYEDWLPYVLAVLYVAFHHGIAGTLDPGSVFNHPDAILDPWKWATIHALFILGLSAALVVAWNVIETARSAETRAVTHAEDLKRQLHAQEKMAALGSLVAGLAHEVRTPLTVVSTSAAVLESAARRTPDDPLARRVITQTGEIQASVDRMNKLVLQLRRFHALAPDETTVASLDVLVRDALRFFSSANRSARVIIADLQPTPPTRLHALGLHQVAINLLTNAVEATDPAAGRVTIRTSSDTRHALLVIEDNGAGMSDETLRRAFDPLFTTKQEGMGLGLHIVKRIVDAHDGEIAVSSAPGRGTTFTVRFPLATDVPPPPAAIGDAPLTAAPALGV